MKRSAVEPLVAGRSTDASHLYRFKPKRLEFFIRIKRPEMSPVYFQKGDQKNRYVLGSEGEKPLLAIGLNPSTAVPQKLDATTRKLEGFAHRNLFDSWLIFNLYPQRSTEPRFLHKRKQSALMKKNIQVWTQTIERIGAHTVLACWGNEIERRHYLMPSLAQMASSATPFKLRWKRIGPLTKAGHPRHPSRAAYALGLQDFDLESYLNNA